MPLLALRPYDPTQIVPFTTRFAEVYRPFLFKAPYTNNHEPSDRDITRQHPGNKKIPLRREEKRREEKREGKAPTRVGSTLHWVTLFVDGTADCLD